MDVASSVHSKYLITNIYTYIALTIKWISLIQIISAYVITAGKDTISCQKQKRDALHITLRRKNCLHNQQGCPASSQFHFVMHNISPLEERKRSRGGSVYKDSSTHVLIRKWQNMDWTIPIPWLNAEWIHTQCSTAARDDSSHNQFQAITPLRFQEMYVTQCLAAILAPWAPPIVWNCVTSNDMVHKFLALTEGFMATATLRNSHSPSFVHWCGTIKLAEWLSWVVTFLANVSAQIIVPCYGTPMWYAWLMPIAQHYGCLFHILSPLLEISQCHICPLVVSSAA